MALPITGLLTTRDSVGRAQPNSSSSVLRNLPSGSAFHIYGVSYNNGQLWVKSGAGHWYHWTDATLSNNLFMFAPSSAGGWNSIGPRFRTVGTRGEIGGYYYGNWRVLHSFTLSGAS